MYGYRELLEGGWSPQALRTAVATGALVHLRRGWYADPGDATARLRSALACHRRAALSHRTAAGLHGFAPVPSLVDVTVPHGAAVVAPPGVRIHHSTLPMPVRLLHGFPVTSPVRTVLDIARTASYEDGVAIADAALFRRACSKEELVAALPSLTRTPGAPRARRAVAACRFGAQSPMETRTRLLLVDEGIPEPVLQHRVVVAGRAYLLDLAWPEQRVCVEYDGHEHHSSPADAAADRIRWRLLHDAGWDVRPVTAVDLRDREAFAAEIMRSLRLRGGCC